VGGRSGIRLAKRGHPHAQVRADHPQRAGLALQLGRPGPRCLLIGPLKALDDMAPGQKTRGFLLISEGDTKRDAYRCVLDTSLINFFDLCAISLPLPRSSGLPVGLSLAARNWADRRLLRIAMSIERLL